MPGSIKNDPIGFSNVPLRNRGGLRAVIVMGPRESEWEDGLQVYWRLRLQHGRTILCT